jgi:hypothetical protein
MRHARADHKLIAASFGMLELGKPRYIDDQIRLDETKIEHRTERLSARHDLGGAFGLSHQGNGRIQA